MAKYSDIKFPLKQEEKEIEFNGVKIKVNQSISEKDIYDLIMITIEDSKDSNGIYNDYLLDMHLALNLIYLCTNIEFTKEDKEDEFKLYNELLSFGLIKEVILALPNGFYNRVYDYIGNIIERNEKNFASIGTASKILVNELPSAVEKMVNLSENFNLDDYVDVINFAKSVNGDRPIPNSEPVE